MPANLPPRYFEVEKLYRRAPVYLMGKEGVGQVAVVEVHV